MTTGRRRRLAAAERAIKRQPKRAVRFNDAGQVLSASNLGYEVAEKMKAIAHGGIGAIHRLVERIGLAQRIDDAVAMLQVHQPYYESDHVLNIAYNVLCGGQTLNDIEQRRQDRVFVAALGTESLTDPGRDLPQRFRARSGRLDLRPALATEESTCGRVMPVELSSPPCI